MKKIILLTIFSLGVGASAYGTPLISEGTAHTLNIESTNYLITDRASLLDTWVPLDGYTGGDYTGLYLGTIDGNDSKTDLENLIGYFLNDDAYTITDYAKWAYDNVSDDWSPEDGNTGLVSVSTTDGGYSGIWTAQSPYALDFYTVKSSTEFALYYVEPAMASGDWVTRHVLSGGGNLPEISHFSASLTPSAPIPEPATMLLFGTGLVGLAGARLRKKKN